MLAYPNSPAPNATLAVRIIGLGNAGVHLADKIALAGLRGPEIIAINTDAQSLAASVAPRKSHLGVRATRGLGAGGDPEVGHEAAQESLEEIRFAVEGASVVILACGLGGGTGSGAAPVVAHAAREAGALVLAVVTLPFSFEGRRRANQAAQAEAALAAQAHAVIRFENDRMAELTSPRAGIGETFAASDELLGAAVHSLLEMLSGRGPMPVQLGSLLAVLGSSPGCAVFGRGESSGENRAHEALEAAFRSPLLDRGRMLSDARSAIAHICGPADLTFAETSAVMAAVSKAVPDDTPLFLGVSLTDSPAVSVTLLATCGDQPPPPREPAREIPHAAPRPAPAPRPAQPPGPAHVQPVPQPARPQPAPAVEAPPRVLPAKPAPAESLDEILSPKPPGRLLPDDDDAGLFADEPPPPPPKPAPTAPPQPPAPVSVPAPAPAPVPRIPPPPAPGTAQAPVKKPAEKPSQAKVKQETLQFESVARGRFEKSEPTIVEGEDLDIPTFLRINKK